MRVSAIGMLILALISCFSAKLAEASTYALPASGDSVIGQTQYMPAIYNENVGDITSRFDLGFNEVADANPQIDPGRGFSTGVVLKLPMEYILPSLPRDGIIVNLSEMRLYYFLPDRGLVKTYPVGIGKIGKTIPVTRTIVSRKVLNPTWTPTENIRAFNREQGVILPASIPPGPDNPLGPYAIYLGIPEYRIHSTIYPDSVGRRASFGCIRMIEKDIKDIFPLVTAKTPVWIVDIPTKVGWKNNRLFLEAHRSLEERPSFLSSYEGMVNLIDESTHGKPVFIDWQMVDYIAQTHDGVPHEVGIKI